MDEHYARSLPSYYAALTVGSHNYYDGRAEGDVTPFVDYFCAGMADAFTKVRTAAAQAAVRRPVGAIEGPVRPELVAEITYMTWSDDGLLRHTVFVGLRVEKPAREVRRETPDRGG